MTPTPPSTTSSSAGAHSPEGQYRIIRKRNRVPLSCAPCRHRKLKCNRAHPCENCVKRGDASSCTYAQVSTRKKSSPLQSTPTSPDDMQNRIDRLESLVLSLMTNGSQSAGPAAAMAVISGESSGGSVQNSNDLDLDLDEDVPAGPEESDTEQVTKSFGVMKMDNKAPLYISDAHWASVLDDIAEVRNYFSTHKKQYEEHAAKIEATKPCTDMTGSSLFFGSMTTTSRAEIMSSFPSKYMADILVTRYFNSHDPATHLLHAPTFQVQYNKHWEDPSQTSLVWIGMLFAMMRLALLSYYKEEDEPAEFRGKSLDMAGTYRNQMAQCLALADYTRPHQHLIETLIFHLHGDFCQTREADVSTWVLVGVVARLAMRMGYHRDSKMFPNITPFQGEMRRRVWAFVQQTDLSFSFQVGLPSMLRTTDSDTEPPRNLYDDDFSEDSTEIPPSRPLSEPTPISQLIAKYRLVHAFGRVTEAAAAVQSTPYDTVMEIDAELRQARDMIPEHLKPRSIEESHMDPTNLIIVRFSIASVYHKAQCVLHRRFLTRARENPRFTYSRQTCIDSAMELLNFQSMLHGETGLNGHRSTKQNRLSSLCTSDFLLAATIICLDLHQTQQIQAAGRESGDIYTWGRERGEEMIAALRRSKEIWDEIRDQSLKAWKATSVLEVMLGKLHLAHPLPEPNVVAPTLFESQDEKQNAAMTLGLLSSGMSPIPTGPSAFNDSAFKMSDANVPLSGLAPATDLPGAPSPLGSMFGQMPDMQVNLDWDAWDNYIQNSNFDANSQWFLSSDLQSQQQQQQQQTPNDLSSTRISQPVSADGPRAMPRFPSMLPPQTYDINTAGPPIPPLYNADISQGMNGSRG
ncbi:hypothetical protein ASPZODRAFT_67377 [Penicilliopsis zonata CBS 506.65]|uniref:Zn(2)-C6 fungal-type domain-containing protein n=1 Tax=Penicilliopsis zonata CBS 506.65 TaxID=1073090 RepID=A0A1L9SG02_9EURO|nr:hypothetical protein ASPZODRAFT_67377 [Penicilliopsis zonata CBS 506.65]OJJ46101.1 hypothetical protein ASPZODRAFT_67377 [Penicilliopsis zonata CBS 506.65]